MGEGCTPGFWQGGNGSKLWDTSPGQQWTDASGVGDPPFIQTTKFNDIFAPWTENTGIWKNTSLANLSMMDLVGTGGGNEWPLKTARMVVAAYLNSSFGMSYPYTPTEIANMWTDVVNWALSYPNQNRYKNQAIQKFQDVFNALGAANNLACPID